MQAVPVVAVRVGDHGAVLVESVSDGRQRWAEARSARVADGRRARRLVGALLLQLLKLGLELNKGREKTNTCS